LIRYGNLEKWLRVIKKGGGIARLHSRGLKRGTGSVADMALRTLRGRLRKNRIKVRRSKRAP